MAMNRRRFLEILAAPVRWAAGRVLPARYVEAVRGRVYPGPLKRFTAAEIDKPGKWLG